MRTKKGVIDQLQSLITPLIGIAIVLVVGFLIIAQAKTQVISTDSSYCGGDSAWVYNITAKDCYESVNHSNTTTANHSAAFNATETTQGALADIPGWLPIIVITVIGAILIGLVAMFRSGKF